MVQGAMRCVYRRVRDTFKRGRYCGATPPRRPCVMSLATKSLSRAAPTAPGHAAARRCCRHLRGPQPGEASVPLLSVHCPHGLLPPSLYPPASVQSRWQMRLLAHAIAPRAAGDPDLGCLKGAAAERWMHHHPADAPAAWHPNPLEVRCCRLPRPSRLEPWLRRPLVLWRGWASPRSCRCAQRACTSRNTCTGDR